MKGIYLTIAEAEEILMAAEIGMYNYDYPGAKSKLIHARLLIASQPTNATDAEKTHG